MDLYLTPYTENNSKWIKDLIIRAETIKLLRENREETLLDNGPANSLWISYPRLQKQNQIPNGIKLKSFCTAEETINKIKRQLTGWEKIFTNYVSAGA